MDALAQLTPPLRVGERVSLALRDRELLGFVTGLTPENVRVVDRHGEEHDVPRSGLVAGKRVGVALGRNPLSTPPSVLVALASRAQASGTAWVCRISSLLGDRTPPESVAPWGEWATFDGVRARFEGEWVTLADAPVDAAVAAAWWATRMGARSVQVCTDDPSLSTALAAAGFVAHPG